MIIIHPRQPRSKQRSYVLERVLHVGRDGTTAWVKRLRPAGWTGCKSSEAYNAMRAVNDRMSVGEFTMDDIEEGEE